jgi:glycosyltransferase involved in cell wall biosynthesis
VSSDNTESNEPLVAIVIPAYNSAAWVEETLASVLAQTAGSAVAEVAVVDDGSTDGTAEVARRWLADTPLRWRVLRQPNRGPGAARNAGLRATTAPWVQFLDADDLLDPHKIEIQLAAARTADPETALVHSAWQRFGLLDPRWESGRVETFRPDADVLTDLLYASAIATGSQLFSRLWLDRVGGYDERFRYGEDYDLYFRLLFAGGKFVLVDADRPLFFYRRHGPSLSTHPVLGNAEVPARYAAQLEAEFRRRGDLSGRRLDKVINLYALGARSLASFDLPAAQECLNRLDSLAPGYRPPGGGLFGLLCRLVGYRHALWLWATVRRWCPRGFHRPPVPVAVPCPLALTTPMAWSPAASVAPGTASGAAL